MLTKRQKELLELLAQQSDFQTVEYFASKLGVSKRTTHSELRIIEDYLQSSGEYLEKKRGVGIAIKRFKEVEAIEEKKEASDIYNTFNRRVEIMNILLFKEKVVSFNHLSDSFMVSKTSIIKDFEFIMKILNVGSRIKLCSDIHGTSLIGSEEDIQKALLQFNRYLLNNSELYDEDFAEKIKLLDTYYGESLINVCSNILYTYIRENVNAISDYYVQNILNIFIILVFRIAKGHHIEELKRTDASETTIFFEESAVRMLHKAALRLELTYTNEDVHYLSLQLISNRFEPLPEEEIDEVIVERLLSRVSAALNINFASDQKLEEQLKNHIPPMIYRLRSNNKTENPFTSQIKNEFSLTFNVIWVVLSEYEQELGISFNEDEIAFLTMYFQAAIERARMNRKILIVCQMGIATSELLINRIKNVLPSLDTFEVASVAELEQMPLNEYDLIISTIKVDLPKKQVILVSPFLTKEDIERIKQSDLLPKAENNVLKFVRAHHLMKFVDKDFVFVNTDFTSKEELIEQMGEVLTENGFVTQQFIQTVQEREEMGSTDLPTGTAVPHGNSTCVNQTIIVLVKNKKKFKWNKYYVDLVFLICIAKQDTFQTRNILADIYNIIDSNEQLKQLREATTNDVLFRKLGSE
ncbi:transcription antiterminator [Enterococcus avium]|uniref:BglG family transcription antiterminator n=1 Tax=Enterococcus avium TaxID=33945 RepID=UPI00159D27DC|nr:PTS sugar transporter subunit IIA [Enterococcus avium]MBO1141516.1 transcription antiterminator [Enterococcus avium]MDT2478372.1 PTS sugar transporter subunit IIA [Enterococcus avium]NVN77491.1 PRD domain-containing protein [Enterococcus avium]